MWRALAGAKTWWVHGLPWLGYVTLPAKSLELKCSREPAWETLGPSTEVGSSLTSLELQRDGSRGAKHIRAKYIGQHWRKGAARVRLRGMQQEWKLCTSFSIWGRGCRGFGVALRWGCGAGWCFWALSPLQERPAAMLSQQLCQLSCCPRQFLKDQHLQFGLARSIQVPVTGGFGYSVSLGASFPSREGAGYTPWPLLGYFAAQTLSAPISLWPRCGARTRGAGCGPQRGGGNTPHAALQCFLKQKWKPGKLFLKTFSFFLPSIMSLLVLLP